MASENLKDLKIIAPAKVNLFLHVTGKRKDGYHLLQSLVTFANYGDNLTITPAEHFSITIDNPFTALDEENNLVTRAANTLAQTLQKDLDCNIHLTKKIPIGAGLGGGSADAATTIKGLLQYWNESISGSQLDEILVSLGADVPICYQNQSAIIQGIGEEIIPLPSLPDLPTLLVYPNKFCPTIDIFKTYEKDFSSPIPIPEKFTVKEDLYDFLKQQTNDLTQAACHQIPTIKDVLTLINKQQGCALSRMSGSGSSCFGLFDNVENSQAAALSIQKENPDWWVQPVIL